MRDADCPATTETLLVDGANGVCRDVRLDAPSGHAGHALALVIAAAAVAWWMSTARVSARVRRVVLVSIAVLAAISYLTLRRATP